MILICSEILLVNLTPFGFINSWILQVATFVENNTGLHWNLKALSLADLHCVFSLPSYFERLSCINPHKFISFTLNF